MIFKKKKEIEKTVMQREVEARLKDISESREEEQNVLNSFDEEIKNLVVELLGTTDADEYKSTLDKLERLIKAKEGYNGQVNDDIENLKKLVDAAAYVDGEKKKKIDPNNIIKIGAMLIALVLTLGYEYAHNLPKGGWSIFSKFLPNVKD